MMEIGVRDSKHVVVDCPELKEGELHRFQNAGGVPYSAIYVDGIEMYSCERDKEERMIQYANSILAR